MQSPSGNPPTAWPEPPALNAPPPRPTLLNARPALIKVNGTCCLIFSLKRSVVLPMYLRSHAQVTEYTKLLKVIKGKISLLVVEKIEREEKQHNIFRAGKVLETIWEIRLSNLMEYSPSHDNLRYIGHFFGPKKACLCLSRCCMYLSIVLSGEPFEIKISRNIPNSSDNNEGEQFLFPLVSREQIKAIFCRFVEKLTGL